MGLIIIPDLPIVNYPQYHLIYNRIKNCLFFKTQKMMCWPRQWNRSRHSRLWRKQNCCVSSLI